MSNEKRAPRTEQDIESYERECPLERRIPNTVYEVFRSGASAFGDSNALTMVITGASDEVVTRISYSRLYACITQTANLFASLGGKGMGIAYLLPTLLETHFTLWAAESIGYAVPLNPLLQVDHLQALVEVSGACVLVTCGPSISPEIWEKALAIRRSFPGLTLVCIRAPHMSDDDSSMCIDFQSAVEVQDAATLAVPLDLDPHRVVAYFHTGGTTGTPKLVAHTNRNQLTAALGTQTMLGLVQEDVVTNGMPLFHVGGAIASSLAFFMCGGQVVTLSPFGLRNPAMVKNFWRIVEREGVTIMGAVPTALSAILSVPLDANLSRVKLGITGSASTPRKVAEGFKAVTGRDLHEILGMTESGGVTAIDPAAGSATVGSVGYRLPYTTLSVRKRQADGSLGEECVPGEVGVLVVSGPTVSPGYRTAAHGAATFVDGQLNTGDLAYRDDDGKLFIAGRAKDLIIRSGHNIDPSMIESAFLAHTQVVSAAAVGEPDQYAGELPVCYVVLVEGATATLEDLLEFSKSRIAERPAWPKRVYVLPALPLTGVGKVYKPALRADAAQRVLLPVLKAIAGEAIEGVTASDGGPRGLRVTVQLRRSSEALRAKVEAVLGAYIVDAEVIEA